MQRALLLNVIVGEGALVVELLAGEYQALLVRGNALLVHDFLLQRRHSVARLHLHRYRFTRQRLYENLHVIDGSRALTRQI
ncbi:ORF49 [Betabaculovirus altermyunipunctae]|uniref:ORF49 n=1 Tax=Betabaculovirus altermyunipunctae TaxID=3051996 RepID=A0A1S5YE58_9BBAC|nr:ORF49 [Betabaculovirus altermyunipunctae]AQQ80316.1 ORF49 [Betabaculovirus altermyunipunctae]